MSNKGRSNCLDHIVIRCNGFWTSVVRDTQLLAFELEVRSSEILRSCEEAMASRQYESTTVAASRSDLGLRNDAHREETVVGSVSPLLSIAVDEA